MQASARINPLGTEMPNTPFLQVRDLQLSFSTRDNQYPILSIDEMTAYAGEHLVITGPSGAGKTSLLYVLTGIERPDQGQIIWQGEDICTMQESQRDHWRCRTVGFIFQDFFLFSGMSILNNVMLPSTFDSKKPQPERASMLLDRVGITSDQQDIETLSRGEKQRVAIARALLLSPDIIVADEPTASLDRETAQLVIELLRDIVRKEGILLCCVSHDPDLIRSFSTIYRLENGSLQRIATTGKIL